MLALWVIAHSFHKFIFWFCTLLIEVLSQLRDAHIFVVEFVFFWRVEIQVQYRALRTTLMCTGHAYQLHQLHNLRCTNQLIKEIRYHFYYTQQLGTRLDDLRQKLEEEIEGIISLTHLLERLEMINRFFNWTLRDYTYDDPVA